MEFFFLSEIIAENVQEGQESEGDGPDCQSPQGRAPEGQSIKGLEGQYYYLYLVDGMQDKQKHILEFHFTNIRKALYHSSSCASKTISKFVIMCLS